jgi:hypothetical protein
MHVEDLTVMFSGRHWHKPFKTLWRERAKHGARILALPVIRVLSNSTGKVNKVRREAGEESGCWLAVEGLRPER